MDCELHIIRATVPEEQGLRDRFPWKSFCDAPLLRVVPSTPNVRGKRSM
jgi:hypothetical protein